MSKKHLPTFDVLASLLLEQGRKAGSLSQSELDSLLHHPEFSETAFDTFLDVAKRMDIIFEEGEEKKSTQEAPILLDSLQVYLRDIGRFSLLTPEEEQRLAKEMREGTTPHRRHQARRKMIQSNLRLVVKIAGSYMNRGLLLQDLIEEGNLGLIAGVDRFDYSRGFRFSTYGSWWIKQAVSRGIASQARTVRIPYHVIQLVNRYLGAESRLRQREDRAPTLEAVAQAIHEKPARIKKVRHLITSIKNLDYERSWDSLGALAEIEMLRPATDFEEQLDRILEHERLNRLLGRLSSREETVIRLRFGFDDGERHSLSAAGQQIGVSRERIRQIEKQALERLRHFIEFTEMEIRKNPRQDSQGD